MHYFEFKSKFVRSDFTHLCIQMDQSSRFLLSFSYCWSLIKQPHWLAFVLPMAAHHMTSSTLLPAASRWSPSSQTAQHPFSVLQSLLNKLDVVINAPLRHVQLREASACCSRSRSRPVLLGVLSGAGSRSWACSRKSVLPLQQLKGYFYFLHFFLPGYITESLLRRNSLRKRRKIADTLTCQAFTLWFIRYHGRKEIKLHRKEFSLKSVNLWSKICSKHNKICGRNMYAILISQLIPTTNNYTLLPNDINRFTLIIYLILP